MMRVVGEAELNAMRAEFPKYTIDAPEGMVRVIVPETGLGIHADLTDKTDVREAVRGMVARIEGRSLPDGA